MSRSNYSNYPSYVAMCGKSPIVRVVERQRRTGAALATYRRPPAAYMPESTTLLLQFGYFQLMVPPSSDTKALPVYIPVASLVQLHSAPPPFDLMLLTFDESNISLPVLEYEIAVSPDCGRTLTSHFKPAEVMITLTVFNMDTLPSASNSYSALIGSLTVPRAVLQFVYETVATCFLGFSSTTLPCPTRVVQTTSPAGNLNN